MGAITSSSIATLGSGYSALDTLGIIQPGGVGARLQIITVDGSGVPLTFAMPEDNYPGTPASTPYVVHRGCGYSLGTGLATQNFGNPPSPAVGSGLTLDILSVGPGSDATHGVITGFDYALTPLHFYIAGTSGYAPGDTGLIIQGANDSSPYVVGPLVGPGDADGPAGALLAVNGFAYDNADGYAHTPALAVSGGRQPGSGSGFALTPYTSH